MQTASQTTDRTSHIEIARVARQLWQQAGWPPGRYVEYWTKVEAAITDARKARVASAAVAGLVEEAPVFVESDTAGAIKLITTTGWEQAHWVQPVLGANNAA